METEHWRLARTAAAQEGGNGSPVRGVAPRMKGSKDRGARSSADNMDATVRATSWSSAAEADPSAEGSWPWVAMGRYYIGYTKGLRNLLGNLTLEIGFVIRVGEVTGTKGLMMREGKCGTGVTPSTVHKGPLLTASSGVACNGGMAFQGRRMTTFVWNGVVTGRVIDVKVEMGVVRRAVVIGGNRG